MRHRITGQKIDDSAVWIGYFIFCNSGDPEVPFLAFEYFLWPAFFCRLKRKRSLLSTWDEDFQFNLAEPTCWLGQIELKGLCVDSALVKSRAVVKIGF